MHSTRSVAMSRIQLAVSLCDAMSLNPKTIATISDGCLCFSLSLSLPVSLPFSLCLSVYLFIYLCVRVLPISNPDATCRERTLRVITKRKLHCVIRTFVILPITSNLIKSQRRHFPLHSEHMWRGDSVAFYNYLLLISSIFSISLMKNWDFKTFIFPLPCMTTEKYAVYFVNFENFFFLS